MDRPVVYEIFPAKIDIEEAKQYFWCSCGRSENQPFCDGSHRETELKPVIFEPEPGLIFLCQCKKTANPPYCDGAHKTLDKAAKGQLLE